MRVRLGRGRGLVAALAALMMSASAAVVGSAPATAQPQCPGTYALAIPGTWETGQTGPSQPGMLSGVVDTLRANGVRADYVSYAATAFPWEGETYGASKNQAVAAANLMIQSMALQCPSTTFALVGYSQGADAVGDVAAAIGTGGGVIRPERLVAVGLLSDPRRSEADTLVGPAVAGSGVGGARPGGFGWVTPVVRTFCVDGDLYCSTPKDDYVSRMAGFLAIRSDPSPTPELVAVYQTEAVEIWNNIAAVGGVGFLQQETTDPEVAARRAQLEQFYKSGVHQNYATYVVDRSGTTATQWVTRYILDQS